VSARDEARWVVRKDGQGHGPFTADELASMVAKGQLEEAHTLLDTTGETTRRAGDHPGLRGDFEARDRARTEAARKAAARRAELGAQAGRWARRLLALGVAGAVVAVIGWRAITREGGLDPIAVALVAITVLAVAWAVRRADPRPPEEPWQAEPSWAGIGVGAALALGASAPLLRVAPWLGGRAPAGFGDELTLARVAADLARDGLRNGWVASYLGGFPLAGHEESLTLLVLRGLIGVGASPLGATHALGTLAVSLAPLALFAAVLRCGGRIPSALAAALVLAWSGPDTPLAGGWDAFFSAGLLSRAIALPLCILAAAELARAELRWSGPALATLALLFHPPLAFATLLATTCGAALASAREQGIACARAIAAAGAVGVACFGPSLLDRAVPFGPPAELAWRTGGFPLSRLAPWLLDGSLLDAGRPPVLSYVVGAAALALLLRAREPSARALLGGAVLVLALPVLGPIVAPLAPLAVATVAPLHAIALAPVAAAAVVAVVLEEATPLVEGALLERDERLAQAFRLGGGALLFAVLALALPARLAFTGRVGETLDARASAPCGPLTPEGYAHDTVHGWLAALARGRLWYATSSFPASQCMDLDALQLSSAVPLAATNAMGSHVGTLWRAFSQLAPEREGSAARAEALGVRHVLDAEGRGIPPGWRASGARGDVSLATHDGPTDLVGAGCIVARWIGTDDALRTRLDSELGTPEGTDRLLSPTALIALVPDDGTLREEPVDDDCDATTARVTEVPREPGALEADVASRAPVDVVFRATAFGGWTVIVDGVPATELVRVAPGFVAVRVPAGRHHVLARVGALPHQGWAVLGAALVALFAATARRSWFERAR
jgi:hypothetical protein